MRVPFGNVTALEWLRKLVAEEVRVGRGHAQGALNNAKLLKNKSYVVAAHRLVLLVMATTVSPAAPHFAGEEYLWRGASEPLV